MPRRPRAPVPTQSTSHSQLLQAQLPFNPLMDSRKLQNIWTMRPLGGTGGALKALAKNVAQHMNLNRSTLKRVVAQVVAEHHNLGQVDDYRGHMYYAKPERLNFLNLLAQSKEALDDLLLMDPRLAKKFHRKEQKEQKEQKKVQRVSSQGKIGSRYKGKAFKGPATASASASDPTVKGHSSLNLDKKSAAKKKMPMKVPVKISVKVPGKALAKCRPVKSPSNALVKAPSKSLVKTPVKYSSKALVKSPSKTRAKAPVKALVRSPVKSPSQNPVKAYPAKIPGKTQSPFRSMPPAKPTKYSSSSQHRLPAGSTRKTAGNAQKPPAAVWDSSLTKTKSKMKIETKVKTQPKVKQETALKTTKRNACKQGKRDQDQHLYQETESEAGHKRLPRSRSHSPERHRSHCPLPSPSPTPTPTPSSVTAHNTVRCRHNNQRQRCHSAEGLTAKTLTKALTKAFPKEARKKERSPTPLQPTYRNYDKPWLVSRAKRRRLVAGCLEKIEKIQKTEEKKLERKQEKPEKLGKLVKKQEKKQEKKMEKKQEKKQEKKLEKKQENKLEKKQEKKLEKKQEKKPEKKQEKKKQQRQQELVMISRKPPRTHVGQQMRHVDFPWYTPYQFQGGAGATQPPSPRSSSSPLLATKRIGPNLSTRQRQQRMLAERLRQEGAIDTMLNYGSGLFRRHRGEWMPARRSSSQLLARERHKFNTRRSSSHKTLFKSSVKGDRKGKSSAKQGKSLQEGNHLPPPPPSAVSSDDPVHPQRKAKAVDSSLGSYADLFQASDSHEALRAKRRLSIAFNHRPSRSNFRRRRQAPIWK